MEKEFVLYFLGMWMELRTQGNMKFLCKHRKIDSRRYRRRVMTDKIDARSRCNAKIALTEIQ